MKQAFVEINGVRTSVAAWGQWIEEHDPKDKRDLVLIVPGNPGAISFYDKFAQYIHDQTGCNVWAVGHAGHTLPGIRVSPLPKFEEHPQLYGLKGQIEHKVAFIEKYVPNDVRVYIVGHSIGCYMILELLERPSVKNKISNVYLLCPTIEHMAKATNGKLFCNFVQYITWLIVFLAWIFTVLPFFLQTALLYIYMTFSGVQYDHLENVRALICPGVLKRVFFLAGQEMQQVLDRNDEVIKSNLGKIRFYYVEHDKWVPQSCCKNLKNEIPEAICVVTNLSHAFVLNNSCEVAETVCQWIGEDSQKTALKY